MRERRDHEVDPRAGFLDQEQTFAREIAFARLHANAVPVMTPTTCAVGVKIHHRSSAPASA